MALILWEIKDIEHPVAVVERQCPKCSQTSAMIRKEKKKVFKVWFIPIIPLGFKKIDLCLSCGGESKAKEFQRDITEEFLSKDYSTPNQ